MWDSIPTSGTTATPATYRVSPYGDICVILADVVNREASDLSKRVAAELRAARARLGFTWTDIEAATGISHSSMQRYLAGDVDIRVDKLMLICEAAGLDVAEILEDATRHAPYELHDLLTDQRAPGDVSEGDATVTNIEGTNWNQYSGKKAADIDDEVQEDS